MIIFGLGGFYLAKFKYKSESGLSLDEQNTLRSEKTILETKLEQTSLLLIEKERLLKIEQEQTRNLGQNLASRSSELKSAEDRTKDLESKYQTLSGEFKTLQQKSIELEKTLSGRNIEFKTLEENMARQNQNQTG